MNTSNKIINKRAKDPVERLIFEKGLRIAQVLPVKKQDGLIIFLNNKTTIHVRLSAFERLKKATQLQLNEWKLISGGVGINWPALDEDISLKGLINQLILENTLRSLDGSGDYNFAVAA